MLRFFARITRYKSDRRGAAAAEFAIILTVLVIPLLNAIDCGVYAYDYMELRHAAQVAAQAAWATCSSPNQQLPAGLACSGLSTAAQQVADGTPLGTNAVVSFGASACTSSGCSVSFLPASTPLVGYTSPGEGFACLNKSGALVTTSTQPPNVDEVTAGSTDGCTAHDYIVVKATDPSFAPIFSSASLIPFSTPTALVMMRLD